MNLNSHIQELRRKHQALSQRVETDSRAPSADQLHIAKLKKEKLVIKEQIERLCAG